MTQPHSAASQPLLHPQRRGCARGNPADDAPQVTRTGLRGLDVDVKPVRNGLRYRVDCNGGDRAACQCANLARHALDPEAIAPVRRQVHFDHAVIQSQQFLHAGSGYGISRQFQQTLVIIAHTKFARRAQHPVRLDAAQF